MTWGNVAGAAIGVVGSYLAKKSGGDAGGGGGSGGGNAPPVYIPKNQTGIDNSFNTDFTNYGNTLGNMWGTAGPINTNLLSQQSSGPYAGWLLDNAMAAGRASGAAAGQLSSGSNQVFNTGNNINTWEGLDQNGIYHVAPQIQASFDTMQNLGGQSNDLYKNLIGYQQGQQGNVQGSANNLYGAGNAVLNTAFDPQSALYQDTVNKLTDQTRAAEYARGIQSSPYGASVEANALGNFNLDWQNQQLARQAQGINAAHGAYSGAQGMNTNYVDNLSGLQTGMDTNYSNLATGAENMFGNWSQMQGNVANTFGRGLGEAYTTAGNLANQGVQMQLAQGQYPYAAQQQIYTDRNAALGNYMGNFSPYFGALGNQNSSALAYLGYGSGQQNQAWNQNMANNQANYNAISQISGPLGKAFTNWWNSPSTSSGSSTGGDFGGYTNSFGDTSYDA